MAMKRWKILVGVLNLGGKTYASKKAQDKANVTEHSGDIFETENDMEKHNTPQCVKFMLADEAEEMFTEEGGELDEEGTPNFKAMTVTDLVAFAEENEIELDGKTSKKDVLAIVVEAWG